MKTTKDVIIAKAKEYCINNHLSVDELYKQEIYKIDDIIFAQPMKLKNSDGLKTDLATQPKPTLIYRIKTGMFEKTEYTQKYLSTN